MKFKNILVKKKVILNIKYDHIIAYLDTIKVDNNIKTTFAITISWGYISVIVNKII